MSTPTSRNGEPGDMGHGSWFLRIRAFIRQSLTGVRVESERLREIDPDRIQFQDVIALFIRSWPYVYPMRCHAVAYILLAIFQFLWMTMFAFINFGLIYNNILLDLPVAAISAVWLFLDPSQWVDVEALTREQRIALVPRVVIFGILAVALSNTVGHANAYYRVWILQNINQNLRLHLMSQLQALSLKFHAESKTGDAIYRLFQDSAMVTQILQALVVDPFLACVRFFLGLAVVAAFSPSLALMLLLTWGPMLYLGQRMAAPLRRGFKEARPNASNAEVREAARIACADDFIDKLAEGYSTFLGEKAAKLSSGQRQRLVIARAILKDTPILILDEPTASLDAVTERQIMTNIRTWARQRTVFIITHRLSTVREADRIVFLNDGRIADFGTHTELMAKPGFYRDFVAAELSSRVTA